MHAETLIQVNTLMDILVASLASSLVAVHKPKRRPIVPCRHNTLVFSDDGTIAALHAVGARRRQVGKTHEISVE